MTPAEALETLRTMGRVDLAGDRIRYKGKRSPDVSAAISVISDRKAAALALLRGDDRRAPETVTCAGIREPSPADGARVVATPEVPPEGEPLERVLKGTAICFHSDLVGERVWLVADEADARRLSEPRGSVYLASEVRAIVAVDDPEAVAEIHRFKRAMGSGKLSR